MNKTKKVTILVFLLSVVAVVSLQGDKFAGYQAESTIKAMVKESVKIDKGTTNEYQLPGKEDKLYEPEIVAEGMIQSNLSVPVFFKDKVYGFAAKEHLPSNSQTGDILKLPNGNLLTLSTISNTSGIPWDYTEMATVIFDDQGNIKSNILIENGLNDQNRVYYPNIVGLNKSVDNYNVLLKGLQVDKPLYRTVDLNINPTTNQLSRGVLNKNLDYSTNELRVLDINPVGEIFSEEELLGAPSVYPKSSMNNGHGGYPLYVFDKETGDAKLKVVLKAQPWQEIISDSNVDYHLSVRMTPLRLDRAGNSFYYNKKNQNTMAAIQYTSPPTAVMRTIQQFTSDGSLKKVHLKTKNTIKILPSLHDNQYFYFLEESEKTELKRIDMTKTDAAIEVIHQFPNATRIIIEKNEKEELVFIGQIPDFSGEFQKYARFEYNSAAFVTGTLDSNFEIASLSYFKVTPGMTFSTNEYLSLNEDHVYVNGQTNDQEFVNTSFLSNTLPSPGKLFSYQGFYRKAGDYSPLIQKQPLPLTVNLDQSPDSVERDKKGLTALDRYLISGEEAYNQASDYMIKVMDTSDFDNEDIATNKEERIEFLYDRINRNPNNRKLPIDWVGLGYQNQVGPQQVSYFVSDSQNQASTTTRVVDNISDYTIEKEGSFLDSRNFHIQLTDIQNGGIKNDQAIRKLAKVVAWEAGTGEVVEDAVNNQFSDKKISFPIKSQIDEIRNAKIAKPYPLDIRYEGSKAVTKRIWVFVTKPNTTVDNGVAFYADDFSMDLNTAINATSEGILKSAPYRETEPSVIVYDYDAQPQNLTELVPLSVGKVDGLLKGLSLSTESLNEILKTTSERVISNIAFTYQKPQTEIVTKVKVNVTIFAERKIKIRQVIVDENQEMVQPKSGYGVLKSQNPQELSKEEFSVKMNSSIDNRLKFNDYDFNYRSTENPYTFESIVPMYYQVAGYQVTTSSKIEHKIEESSLEAIKLDLSESLTYWITVYLKPAATSPTPYHWEYEVNKLGEIEIN